MASIGEPVTQPIPSVGTAGTAYATQVNAVLTEVVERLEAAVPVGSLAAAEDPLDMNNQPVQSASYYGLYDQESAPSGSPFGRLVRYDGDLWYVDTDGAIQMTAGGVLNASAIGGIGGDYGGGDPALVYFRAASERYEFYDDYDQLQWGTLRARALEAIDEGTGFVTTVRSSTSATESYTLILPTALPTATGTGGISLLTVSPTTGAMQYAQDAPITGDVTFDTDINLSAGRRLVRPARTFQWPAGGAQYIKASGTVTEGIGGIQASGGAIDLYFNLSADTTDGWRITSVFARIDKSTAGAATVQLYKFVDGSGAGIGAAATSTGTTAETLTQGSLTEEPNATANAVYYLRLTLPANSDAVFHVGYSHEVV